MTRRKHTSSLVRLGKSVDGIAFMAIEHPLVREAVNAFVRDVRTAEFPAQKEVLA